MRLFNDAIGYYDNGHVATSADSARYKYLTGKKDGTKIRDILEYIKVNGPISKGTIISEVLKPTRPGIQLRGYWCTNMASMRDSGLLNYDEKTKTYELTSYSAKLVYTKEEYPALYL